MNAALQKQLGLKPMGEREWQSQVLGFAALHGWRVAHFRAARTAHGWRTAVSADGKGFPDLVLVRGNRLIFAELKRDGEVPTPEQEQWFKALRGTQAEVYLWEPRDWELIRGVLQRC